MCSHHQGMAYVEGQSLQEPSCSTGPTSALWGFRENRWVILVEYLANASTNEVRFFPGPSEITVFHPDVFTAIDGPGTECIKSEWYDLLHPNLSLVTARHKPAHTARRRQWKYGLNSKGEQ